MKNIQIVSRLVARENNYDADVCEDVNNFYWKNVKKDLSSMEYTSVSVKHLCTFTISKRKVDHFIKTTIKKIRNIRKSTRYKQSTIALLLDFNYDKLRKALYQRNILAKQYYENYIKRTSRIRETPTDDSRELGQSVGRDLESSEGGVWNVEGRGTAGDNEETPNLCDVPIQ